MTRLTFALFALLSGCTCQGTTTETPAPAAGPRPDVLLITLDTTRADRLGSYGHKDAHTPALDALAEKGRRYSRVYAPIPLTIPSHAGLFTGIYPAKLGIRSNGEGLLGIEQRTLAEILHDEGYVTAASVAAFVTTRVWGFDQGFDTYFDDIPSDEPQGGFWHAERPGQLVVDDALGWLEKRDREKPAFLWVHLYDAHFPFTPSPADLALVGNRPYDGELAYVDRQVARLLEAVADKPTLIVVVGDHGEGLFDHSELNHGLFLYDNTQRVPLIVAGPGIDPGVSDEPMSSVDVLPTLLSALGIAPPAGIDGVAMPGGAPHPIYMESYQLRDRFGLAPHVAVVDGRFKLIDTPRPELYDLLQDPGEATNVAESHPDDVARLRKELSAFAIAAPHGPDEKSASVDPAMAMQLEALGYVEGGFTGDTSGPLPDPKDQGELLKASQDAEFLVADGKIEEALAKLTPLVAAHPDVIEFAVRRATVLGRLERFDEAASALDAVLTAHPGNASLQVTLGNLRARQGRYREASKLFQGAAEKMPYAPGLRTMAVASLLGVPEGPDEGLALGAEYLSRYPDDYGVAGQIGVELAHRHDSRAPSLLELAILADRPEREVAFELAQIHLLSGDNDGARTLLENELEHYPDNPRAARGLITVLAEQRDWEAEIRVADLALERENDDPMLWHAKAQAEFNVQDYAKSRETLDAGLVKNPDDPHLILLDANLLAKEGKREEGQKRFEAAKAAQEKVIAAKAENPMERPKYPWPWGRRPSRPMPPPGP